MPQPSCNSKTGRASSNLTPLRFFLRPAVCYFQSFTESLLVLTEAYGHDAEMRHQVERLLRNLDRAGNFVAQGESAGSDPSERLALLSQKT